MSQRRLKIVCQAHHWVRSRRRAFKRRLIGALIWTLLLSLMPWSPPALRPAVERAFQDAPQAVQWAAPLALEITRWTDHAFSRIGPAAVHAAGTLTLSMSSDPLAIYTTTTPAEEFSYYLTVANTDAPGQACHVVLTENLPPQLRFTGQVQILDDGGVQDGCWSWSAANGGALARIFSYPYDDGCKLDGGQEAVFRVRTRVQGPLADSDWITSAAGSYTAYNVDDGEWISYPLDVAVPVHAPELAISKQATPRSVSSEAEPITFTLSISNSGRYTLYAHPTLGGAFTLIVTDRVPWRANLVSFAPFSAQGTGYGTVRREGDTLIWTVPFVSTGLGDFEPGDLLTATMVVTVTPPFTYGDAIVNADYRVSIAEAGRIVPPDADGEPVVVTVLGYPDLSIDKSVAPQTVYPSRGGRWTYWITVTNNRPSATGDAVGLVVTDVVPANAVVEGMSCAVPCSTSPTPAPAGTTIAWTFPPDYSLLWNESVAVSCTAYYAGPALPPEGATITNALYGVTASNAPAAVVGTKEVPVTVIGEAYLTAHKTAVPTVIAALPDDSDVIAYTIVVANQPPASADAQGVWITDVVPAHTTLVSAGLGPGTLGTVISPSASAGSVVTWQLSSPIRIGESATVFMNAAVSTPIDDGTQIANAAWVSHAGTAVRSNWVTTTVQSTVTLRISKVASSTVGAGDLLTYTIRYANDGNMVASGVVVTDAVDPGGSVALVTGSPLPGVLPDGTFSWPLPNLAPGGQGQIVLVVRVNRNLDDATIANTARIRCAQGVYADTGPVPTLVKARKIEVSKSVAPAQVRAGERLTYTIAFTNASDIAIQDVYVTDVLPAGFTEVTFQTVDATFSGQVGNAYTWLVDTMPAGDRGTILLSARAITSPVSAAGTVLLNTVETSSTQASAPASDTLPVTVVPGRAAEVAITVVPPTTLVGIPADVTVALRDAYSNPAYDGDNHAVNLAGEPAGLTFDPLPVSIVGGQGTAAVDATAVGTYVVTATVVGRPDLMAAAPVTFEANLLDHLVIGPLADQVAGVDFTLAVTAVDAFDNPLVHFNGIAQIADGATPETLQPDATAPFVNGVLAGQVVSITLARTNAPLIVRAGAVVANSDPFTVSAGPPYTIAVSTARITVPVGSDVLVTATVVDRYDNPVPGAALTFGVTGGTANPPAGTTDAGGVAVSSVSSMLPGEALVTARASNGVVGSAPIAFLACPARVWVTVDPAAVQVGQPAEIAVQAEDASGNPIRWGRADLSAAGLGGGGIVPSQVSLSGGQGTATIGSTLAGRKVVVATTVAEDGCAPVSGQGVVTFTAGAVAGVAVGMSPNPQQAGIQATLYATATDTYGNPVAGVWIAFAAPPGSLGGGGIDPLTAPTDDQGVATTSISSTLIGRTDVKATVVADPAIEGTTVAYFTAGPPRYLAVTVSPPAVESGDLATLAVTMADAYGNPCVWQQVYWDVAPPYTLGVNASIAPNPATADDLGVATASVSATELGTVTIIAQGMSIYTGTAVLTITTGPLAGFQTSAVPDPLGAGVNFTLHITAVDARGVVRTQDNGTVLIADATGTVQPASAPMVAGVATAVLAITQAMVDDWIQVAWAGDPAIVGTTNRFTVTASAPDTIALSYREVLSACVPEAIVAIVLDRYENPVPGQQVAFTHSGVGEIIPETAITDLDGRATTTISATALGPATVRATVAGLPVATAEVTFEDGPPAEMALAWSTDVISAGNSLVYTATVADCGGHPAADEWILTGIHSGAGAIAPASRATDASGQVTFTFTGTLMGPVVIGVADAPLFRVYQEFTVTVEAGPPVTVALSANPSAIAPDGVATSRLVATVYDAYGNPASGQTIRFARAGGLTDIRLSALSAVTNEAGQATTTLTAGTTEGSAVVQAECAGFTTTTEVRVRWFKAYLPVVASRYPSGDLVVSAIQVVPEADGLYEVRVTIENLGPEPVSADFWVDLYLDPDGPIGLNVIWNNVCRRGKAWYVRQDLVPGQRLVLSTRDPDDLSAPGGRYSYWPGDMGRPGDHELWAMADCYGDPPYGAAGEVNERNNIRGPLIYTVPRPEVTGLE